MALTTSLTLKINAAYTNTGLDLSTPIDNLLLDESFTLADGTGANQADVIWHESFSLAQAGPGTNTHALSDSTLTDPLGTAINMSKLKLLWIENTSADANLVIGAGGATAVALFTTSAADSLELPPGGKFLWTAPAAAGLDVTTNEDLKLTHGAQGSSALVYNIVAVGVAT